MIADDSVDVVVSNCVLNLVQEDDRRQLFAEVFRVLKRGGRAVISDIVCDEDVPQHLKDDPQLWSGCMSGAFREDEFLDVFEEAGFYGIEIVARQSDPWAVVEGIEFRSLTLRAWKGKQGPCLDRRQAVIYNGPWKAVLDDDGHTLYRGQRMAVCDKTYNIYTTGPYASDITPVPPFELIPLDDAPDYDCRQNADPLPPGNQNRQGSTHPAPGQRLLRRKWLLLTRSIVPIDNPGTNRISSDRTIRRSNMSPGDEIRQPSHLTFHYSEIPQ